MPTLVKVLRWIAVLPAAIAAMLIARYLVELVGKLWNYDVVKAIELTDGWDGYYINGPIYLFVRQAVMASAFMLVGCLVAPQQQHIVRVVLTVVLGIFIVGGMIAAFIVTNEHNNVRGEFIARNIVLLLSSVVGVAQAYQVDMKPKALSIQ